MEHRLPKCFSSPTLRALCNGSHQNVTVSVFPPLESGLTFGLGLANRTCQKWEWASSQHGSQEISNFALFWSPASTLEISHGQNAWGWEHTEWSPTLLVEAMLGQPSASWPPKIWESPPEFSRAAYLSHTWPQMHEGARWDQKTQPADP